MKSFKNSDDLAPDTKASQRQPVLRRKKAVCEGYANLFNTLCEASGLKAIKVTGSSKNQRGAMSQRGHAWNLMQTQTGRGDWWMPLGGRGS